MVFPALTAFYSALLALLFAALSIWVIAGRTQFNILYDDGGNDKLNRRIRSHGNFAEYVPFLLLLIGGFEADGGSRTLVRVLLLILLFARLAHPLGMIAPAGSSQQYAFRATGALATLLLLPVTAILLLLRLG